jgi:phosphate transport system substrate-binding protein
VNPAWPNEEIKLFGAGTDSGTFDYFTEVINGKEDVSRSDYTATEDDNITINGVANNKFALGYLGLAYYEANKTKVSLAAIRAKGGKEYVLPSVKTVLSGEYKPLSRPLFIYVKKASLRRSEVQEFARFYLRRNDLIATAKYVEMDALQQLEQQDKLAEAIKALGK